ncbi:MAG TPA: bifunctional DNA-binding transcriptional regulator/O6-methylguanine-DNA methyltransferase Ada [Myxococcota bacterium]|nr:bifunctional DNA-binding transcriptional regulator/O6-methylguanine-DNA methyltransferase Ada [Myxococcota bacterium]
MIDDEKCWRAVQSRDASADGAFLYAVRTTGVYCRPSCASRQPRRENVTFHETCAAAEAAGFRACKRCRPTERSAVEAQLAAVAKACAILAERETPPPLAELAGEVGVSPFHFHRLFKQVVGATPREYARAQRRARFGEALDAGEGVAQAAYGAGFGSSSRAYEDAARGLGMTPGARKRGGRGETIRFAVAKTELGWVLVAATQKGVCAAELGDTREALVAAFTARFSGARIREDRAALREWLERVCAFIASPDHALELPLDVQGTAFQAQVWRALQQVPPGSTTSYAALAAALGRPRAVRAVAQACARNPVALAVPCHRAVCSDGGLAGYRWGVERKRALLAREGELAAGPRRRGAAR